MDLQPAQALVVGAGPTGLVLACELKRRGIAVRLIDKKSGPTQESRALGIQARTLETFTRMGIVDKFLTRGRRVDAVTYHIGNKTHTLSLQGLPTAYPFILILPQAETEALLVEHFQSQGGVVEWETTCVDQQTLLLPNGTSETHAIPWIIGCDGAHSTMRHLLDLPFEGAAFPETFFLADVKARPAFPIEHPQIFFTKQGPAVIFPLPQEHHYRLVYPHEPQDIPLTIEETFWSTEFHIHRRMTTRMRVGNVFLAGDAAHIHSPVGGQGMNTSIADAFNLAWKLSAVIRGEAKEALLDTYEAERLPVARKVLKGTSFATKMLTRFSPKLLLPFLTLFHRPLTHAISELSVAYGHPHGKRPGSGERAPDALLKDGSRLHAHLASQGFVLLLFQKREGWELPWVKTVVIEDEAARKAFRAQPKTAFLIRPDGVIGYRSEAPTLEELRRAYPMP